jgi:hypothetical protein
MKATVKTASAWSRLPFKNCHIFCHSASGANLQVIDSMVRPEGFEPPAY